MANSYYSIRVDSAANVLADVKAALLDTYGAYADPANLSGVRFDYDTSPYLIVRCSAIADQYIRFYWTNDTPLFSYGDGVSGNDVTNPVRFGGTNTTGISSAAHLVLGPHTLLWNSLQTTHYSRLVLIGQLSNSDYAVLSCTGGNNVTYNAGQTAYNTTDAIQIWPVCMDHPFQSAAGKLYTQSLVLRRGPAGLSGVELNGDGSAASFQDVYNASHANTSATLVIGGAFILTTSGLYMNGGAVVSVFPTCLLMEFEAVE